MTTEIAFQTKRQEYQAGVALTILRRMGVENPRMEEFSGEIYLMGNHFFGPVSIVVGVRGSKKFLDLPVELKKWKI